MKSIALLICLFSGIAAAAPAAERTCRILFLDGPESAPRTLYLFDGAESTEVDLPRMNLSKVYKLRPGPLKLTLLPEPPEDPENLPAGAPSVSLAETATDIYLLLTSDPSNEVAPVRMHVIAADSNRLKPGGMLWYNLTELTVAGKVGDSQLRITPMSTETLDPPAGENGEYPVDLAFKMKTNESTYPLCETKWRHDPRSKSLVFIIAKGPTRTPRILCFPDFRTRTKEKADD